MAFGILKASQPSNRPMVTLIPETVGFKTLTSERGRLGLESGVLYASNNPVHFFWGGGLESRVDKTPKNDRMHVGVAVRL